MAKEVVKNDLIPGLGTFQAPCGDLIMYFCGHTTTTSMKELRKQAITNHIHDNQCKNAIICRNALEAGNY